VIELGLIFVGGLLGSSHCIGMCGGFALSIGSGAKRLTANLNRQLAYSAGRITTYSFGGAVAGFAGLRLTHGPRSFVNFQAGLSIAAGALLVVQGLYAAGVLPRRRVKGTAGACLSRTLFASFLTAPGLTNTFLAGLMTGFLPCGLVYAYLTLAVSSGHVASGMAMMAAFGLGTVPVMVATGCGGSLLNLAARRYLFNVAAWCVVLTGVVSLARGFGFVNLPVAAAAAGCPFCH